MANWSKKAYQDMADLINKRNCSADEVATLRNLINPDFPDEEPESA